MLTLFDYIHVLMSIYLIICNSQFCFNLDTYLIFIFISLFYVLFLYYDMTPV